MMVSQRLSFLIIFGCFLCLINGIFITKIRPIVSDTQVVFPKSIKSYKCCSLDGPTCAFLAPKSNGLDAMLKKLMDQLVQENKEVKKIEEGLKEGTIGHAQNSNSEKKDTLKTKSKIIILKPKPKNKENESVNDRPSKTDPSNIDADAILNEVFSKVGELTRDLRSSSNPKDVEIGKALNKAENIIRNKVKKMSKSTDGENFATAELSELDSLLSVLQDDFLKLDEDEED